MEALNPLRQRLAALWLQRGAQTGRLYTRTIRQAFSQQQHRSLHSSRLWTSFRPRSTPSPLLRRLRTARHNSTKPSSSPSPNPTGQLGSPAPLTLSQRMRKLSREYGWSAMGVYLLLSALDFPFCFLAVRMLGTDRIAHWEHVVVEGFWTVVQSVWPNARASKEAAEKAAVEAGIVEPADREGGARWGVEEAEELNKKDATIWTQLALAYAIHKSFIFLRVPLTAAVTPKVVKTLRRWGWDIGKRKPKTGAVKKD